MDPDSNLDSPPSSPILGYSGGSRGDEQSLIEAGVVYCLNCKGAPKLHDHTFHAEGYILRREVISAVDNLSSTGNDGAGFNNGVLGKKKPRLVKFFEGRLFDPLEKDQVRLLLNLSRKNLATLEVLSESSHTISIPVNCGRPSSFDDPEDLLNKDPFALRKDVCMFLSLIVRQLKYYRLAWKSNELENMFSGLKRSLGCIKDWSSHLRSHCGFRSGNDCTSAAYHFFHLQLEIRWSLFLIFGASPEIINWILDDLLSLAIHNYELPKGVGGGVSALSEKQPFNCSCVKEIWTMILLVIQELKPQQKCFWNFYQEALTRSTSRDVYFSIWLAAHLAPLTKYTLAGVYDTEKVCDNTGYTYLHNAFREWTKHGGKSTDVLKLSRSIFMNWGGDHEVMISLWNQWASRLDGAVDINNFDSYSTVEKWLKLVERLCKLANINGDEITNREAFGNHRVECSNNDPFMEFVEFAAMYAAQCSEKDWRRFKSGIIMKLSRCKTNDFGEVGIIRVCTFFLSLISVVKIENEPTILADRLVEFFPFAKVRDTPGRRKSIIKAYSCAIILLLQRNISVTTSQHSTVASSYIKIVDELLTQSFHSSQLRKELVSIYINFLESLPNHTPSLSSSVNLNRQELISTNLTLWLSLCGQNYIVRMIRALSELTDWIISWLSKSEFDFDCSTSKLFQSEAKQIFQVLKSKCLVFMKQSVISPSGRMPSTDVEPLANFAADLTFLIWKLEERSVALEGCASQFDLFALNERTCPLVSQYYLERLLTYRDLTEEGCFPHLSWKKCLIRLIFLECSVPESLIRLALGCAGSRESLLDTFCSKIHTWENSEVQKLISPLLPIVKSVIKGEYMKEDSEGSTVVINSVLTCSALLIRKKFNVLYIKGLTTSCGHEFLNELAPQSWPGTPAWEKFSAGALKAMESNIFDIFEAVVNHPGLLQDPFLIRKLQDIIVFAFFGFVREHKDIENKEEHPVIKISEYFTDREDQILRNVILGDMVFKSVQKYWRLLLRVAHFIKLCQRPSLLMPVLPGVIRAYPLCVSDDKQYLKLCVEVVVFCCIFGATPAFQDKVLNGFQVAFEQDFDSRGKTFINMCTSVARTSEKIEPKKRAWIKKFLLEKIVPLIEKYIQLAERKRGHGEDRSLRVPLRTLISEL